MGSILHFYLLPRDKRIFYGSISVKVLPVHVHSGYLMIFVGGVIIYALSCAAAGGVKGDLIFALVHHAAASLLIHRVQNVEKLTYAFIFRAARQGIHLCKCHPNKS